MGAAQHSGVVESRQRNTVAFSYTCTVAFCYAVANSDAKPHSDANTFSYSFRLLRTGLELNPGLYRRHDGEPQWRKLCGQLLDAKSESIHKQRRPWERSTLDDHGHLYWHPIAHSYANADTQTNSNANSNASSISNSHASSFTNAKPQSSAYTGRRRRSSQACSSRILAGFQ
jgi:hypothetical protein